MLDFYISPYFGTLIRVFVLVVIGIPVLLLVGKSLSALLERRRLSKHIISIMQKILFFGGLIVIAVTILHELGFNVAALLGTAGIIGVAVGFASQTSVSNIISGFFLLLERPFSLGDIVSCNGVIGVAESIDLLSVKIRTSDNTLIRLPNEMVLKSRIDTLTYFSTRRIDLTVSVEYTQNITVISSIIHDIVNAGVGHTSIENVESPHGNSNPKPMFLIDPKPVLLFDHLDSPALSSEIRLYVQVRVWAESEKFFFARSMLIEKIKQECDKKDILVTITQNN